jgi:hypothetical protein
MNERRRLEGALSTTGSPSANEETVAGVTAGALLDAESVARLLNVQVSWVRTATRAGILPALSIGRWRRYRAESILAWIEANESAGREARLRSVSPRRPA